MELFNEVEDPVNNTILLRYKGDASSNLGNYEQALQCYDNILKIDSKNIDIQYQKANTLEKLEKYDEALKLFDELLKSQQPNNIEILNKKGHILYILRRYEEALQHYNKILEYGLKFKRIRR